MSEAHAPTGAVVEEPDRWHRVFIVFVTVGIVLSFFLGVREVIREPVIQLDEVKGSEEGFFPPQAQVLARNTSDDVTYCIEVTISATDRDGRALQELVAQPTTGEGELGPGRSANFGAVFEELTEQEVDEELSDYFAFVTEAEEC